jgi:hypothetical protein
MSTDLKFLELKLGYSHTIKVAIDLNSLSVKGLERLTSGLCKIYLFCFMVAHNQEKISFALLNHFHNRFSYFPQLCNHLY